MNRFKNYGLWVSIFALIPLLVQALGSYNIFVYLPDNYETIVKTMLGVLVALGIVSNPTTDTKGYLDDKTQQ